LSQLSDSFLLLKWGFFLCFEWISLLGVMFSWWSESLVHRVVFCFVFLSCLVLPLLIKIRQSFCRPF
jgi:hypothetical protein